MKRVIWFAYGVLSHGMFLALFFYMAAFLANFLVPKSIDSGEPGPFGLALAVNLGLLLLFGASHSIMARPGFKRWWTRFVPVPIERSTYVLVANLFMIFLLWQWQPMPDVVWNVQEPAVRTVLWSLFGLGWLLIFVASLLINHFDLFGTRQVWLSLRGRPYTPPTFGTPLLYRMVRHPIYVGWLLAFWVTPTMTAGHLVFSLGTTVYILIAIQLEERDLIDMHPEYAGYRRRVPMLVPFARPRDASTTSAEALQG